MKSIKAKITAAIVVCSLISAIIISLMSISDSRNMSNTQAEKELALSCENTSTEINALISRVEQSVDTLSDIAMDQMDFSQFQNNDPYVTEYTDHLLSDFLKFSEHTDGAICSYIRYNPDFTNPTSGIFLTRSDTKSDFESVTPTDFSMYDKDDLAHVGWYYIPVANKAPIWMDPYLNENINVYMISYVVPLYENGTSVGILGMDIDFSQITDYADQASAFESGYAFILNSEGNVLYHKDIEVGTDLAEYNNGELASVKDFVANPDNQGLTFEYSYNGTDKYLAFAELDNGMKLVLTAPLKEIKADADTLSAKILGFLLFGIVISVILGIIISSTIANPIKKITAVIRQTAQLDFQKASDVEKLVRKKDETGIMAQAVMEMQHVLRDLVSDMEQVKNNLLGNMSLLDDVMKENNAISEDNSATTQELAAGMEETTASTTMIVGNINAIQDNVSGIQNLSQQEQAASETVMARARQLRDNTAASSDKTMEIYASMKDRTEEAIEKSKVVAKINELTDNIREISSQTNLLALNANIEAARAGEAGRGFAVVATEIGTLANQTFQTVDGINAIVGEVNEAVSNMTECIQVIMNFLEETVVSDYGSFREVGEKYEEDARTFNQSMKEIYAEIADLNTKINDIAETIENVNITITESTEGVNMIAEKSTEAVTKTMEGYEHLRESEESLEMLKGIIEKFEI
ncbi:MAG: methyl-accepting chemotaxis protein [Lachnospiraceae bacterium]